MLSKKWWQSWTIWANLLSLVVLVASAFGFQNFQPDPWVPEVGTVIIILVNLALRYFRTAQPIERK